MDASSGENYAGTAIFLSYIAAALVLVFRQTWNLYNAYNAPRTTQKTRRKAGVFAGLSLFSFGILSFNMLHELFKSYSEYSKRSGSKLSLSDTHLWSWMFHSNLFEEFVDALSGSPVTWWWTQLALLVTMHICIWLAQNYNTRGRGGLAELVLISQILPISFTLNLGYTHVILDPKLDRKEASRSNRFSAIPLLAVVGVYLAGLSYAPAQSTKGSLIPLVFLIRLLMILPSLLTPAVSTSSAHAILAVLAIAMQTQATFNAFSAGYGWTDIAKAIQAHPAVTTLGYDITDASPMCSENSCHTASLGFILTVLRMRYHASSVASLLQRSPCTARTSNTLLRRTYASTTSTAKAHDGPLHLVLLGAPGAGKGTQTDSLLRKYDLQAVVVGNLLRDEVSKKTALGERAAEIMKAGGLLDDATTLDVVRPALKKLDGTDWILDGYPRTPQQAHDLNNALAEWKESINLVVQLDVPDEVLLSRIEARWVHLPSGRVYNTDYNPPKTAGLDDVTGEPLSKRLDDNPEVFKKRLDSHHEKNEPIVEYYRKQGALVTISGSTSAEIWPKLDKVIQDRFPRIKTRA